MRTIGRVVREDLCLHDLVHLAPDPTAPVPRSLPALVDIMSLHGSLRQLGRLYAWQQARERLRKWREKMGEAWLDRPKEVYKWIKNEFQPPVVMGMPCMQCARSAKFWMSANTRTLVLAPFHKFLVPYHCFFGFPTI